MAEAIDEKHYVSAVLSPIKRTKQVIRKIHRVLTVVDFRREVGIVANEPFVGGSIGQGTAVKHHHDLDMVIYSDNIKHKDVVENGYSEIQDKLEKYMAKKLSPHYTYLGRTHVAIQFKYKDLAIDLLLSPHWKTQEEYFRDMRKIRIPRDRFKWFSVFNAEAQKSFIIKQRGRVHELIRRAKAWRNMMWKEDDSGKPRSYLLALLVITAFDRTGVAIQSRRRCKGVVRPVAQEMKKLVSEIANTKDLNLTIPGTDPRILDLASGLIDGVPRIIDPANPINNLYKSGVGPNTHDADKSRWEPFFEKMHTLEKIHTFDISYPNYIRMLDMQ